MVAVVVGFVFGVVIGVRWWKRKKRTKGAHRITTAPEVYELPQLSHEDLKIERPSSSGSRDRGVSDVPDTERLEVKGDASVIAV